MTASKVEDFLHLQAALFNVMTSLMNDTKYSFKKHKT